jgi:hypothetical protein
MTSARCLAMLRPLLILVALGGFAAAEPSLSTSTESELSPSLAVNFGLIQPLVLKGANLEVDYRRNGWVVSYSHGWSLEFAGATAVGEAHDQHLRLHVPYSTGLGVGGGHYFARYNVFAEARAELKVHRFEPWLEDSTGNSLRALPAYRTITVGGGLYATWLPMHRARTVGGVDISLSLRFWPNVWDSLGSYSYANATTGRMETMHAANIGIANTPFLANISVGYLFQ